MLHTPPPFDASKWPLNSPNQDIMESPYLTHNFGSVSKMDDWILEPPAPGVSTTIRFGYHRSTHQRAVVKIIPHNNPDDAIINSRNLILSIINHPNIVNLYGIQRTASSDYIYAERAEFGTLHNHLIKMRSSGDYSSHFIENQIRSYMKQILATLSYCHNLNIYHQQLKVNDILLEDENTVKIANFGLVPLNVINEAASRFTGSTPQTPQMMPQTPQMMPQTPQMMPQTPRKFQTSQPRKPPYYTSPESLHGRLHNGSATEIWSLGVILFQYLTGRLPFEREDNEDDEALIAKIQWGYFDIDRSDQVLLSPSAERLLRRMLDPNVSTRITLDEMALHEWTRTTGEASTMANHAVLDGAALEFASALAAHATYTTLCKANQLSLVNALSCQSYDTRRILRGMKTIYPRWELIDIIQNLLEEGYNAEKAFFYLLEVYFKSNSTTTTTKKAGVTVISTISESILGLSPLKLCEANSPWNKYKHQYPQMSPSPSSSWSPRKQKKMDEEEITTEEETEIAQFTDMIERAFKFTPRRQMIVNLPPLLEPITPTTPIPTPTVDAFSQELQTRLNLDDTDWETEIDFDLPFLKRNVDKKMTVLLPRPLPSTPKKPTQDPRSLPKLPLQATLTQTPSFKRRKRSTIRFLHKGNEGRSFRTMSPTKTKTRTRTPIKGQTTKSTGPYNLSNRDSSISSLFSQSSESSSLSISSISPRYPCNSVVSISVSFSSIDE